MLHSAPGRNLQKIHENALHLPKNCDSMGKLISKEREILIMLYQTKARRWTAVLLSVLLLAALFSGCKKKNNTTPTETQAAVSDVTEIDSYTVKDLSGDDSRLDDVVASCAGRELTNRQLPIYYWMQFISVMNRYGTYLTIDTTKPFYQQESPQADMNWEQLFLRSAVEQFQTYAAVAYAAEADGFRLTEELEKQLSDTLESIDQEASNRGYASADEYLQASFGVSVHKQDYEAYLRIFYLAMSYEEEMYQRMDKACTEADVDAYYESHKENYVTLTEGTKCIDVRHILIMPSDVEGETDEEKNANAKARAEELYAEYLEDPTEEHFAAMATEHSSDTGSAENGGLYQNVLEGRMVESFNDWCFAEERKPGDTDIVETNYGYHIMYFVGANDYLQMTAREDYLEERMNTWLTELIEANPLTVDYSKAVLGEVNLSAAE